MVSRLPLSGNNQTGGPQIEGADASPSVQTRTASPDYFRTLEIPLMEGRFFTSSDGFDAHRVAIVDEQLARIAWPGKSPIGQRIREGGGNPWSTVVGVVGHVRHTGMDDVAQGQVYWNYPQRFSGTDRMALVVRTRGEPAMRTRAVAEAIRDVDPEQPVYDARTLEDVIGRSFGQRRFQMILLGLFAAIALMLASIGAYGVIAYGVGQRLREFGIRIALGAQRREVIAMVLRRGGALFGLGAIIGLTLAAATVQVLASLVYGVVPRDPWNFIASTMVLLAASMAACYVPARRAARVEPSIALRSE